MRIIKEGKSKLKICQECGCEFTYTRKDEKYTYKTLESRLDGIESFSELYVICPHCGTGIFT